MVVYTYTCMYMYNVAECVGKLRTDFGRRKAPAALYVPYLVKKRKKETVHTREYGCCGRKCVWSVISINSPHSQQLNISETSLRRILHKDLGMTAYKVQLVQELKSIDYPMRFRFAKWACDRFTEDANFGKKNIFSDETHFDHV